MKDKAFYVIALLIISFFSSWFMGELYAGRVNEATDIIVAEGEIIGFLLPTIAIIPLLLKRER